MPALDDSARDTDRRQRFAAADGLVGLEAGNVDPAGSAEEDFTVSMVPLLSAAGSVEISDTRAMTGTGTTGGGGGGGGGAGNGNGTIREVDDASFTLLATLLVALGPLSFGMALGYTSPTQAQIAEEFAMTTAQSSLFGALVNVGAMAGALVSGSLADAVGRRMALLWAAICQVLGWGLILTAQGLPALYAGRLILGAGVGVVSFAAPVYIVEISPSRLRGGLGAINQLAITVGITLVYFLGIFLTWRILAAVSIVPLVALLVGTLVVVPETPRWLALKGESEKMAGVMRRLRGNRYDISMEIAEIRAAVASSLSEPKTQLKDVFARGLVRPLVVGVGLSVLQQFCGINAVMFYSSSIFEAAGIRSPNVATLSVGVLQVVMTAVAVGLMDKLGRKVLLVVSASGLAMGNLGMAISFWLKDSLPAGSAAEWLVSPLAILSLLAFIAAFSLGMGAIPWIIMAEIFPVQVKGLAGSLATLMNWLSSFVVTLTFQSLLTWSHSGSFVLFAAECVFTVLFVLRIVPETKGRTLEQIQAAFKTS
ncbi:hypothetical protein CBR_g34488 [Chara braunii]|uniref:Major facilitator superfamily (MFS) profile domain-containing protein n=1 Tax=Chara braunii TaxID=69332 RepID=A0A388LIZ2_CHABU|nr:hypothetical protein CBR_g34488 [Chara braunii]|eukprot:GBG82205.1 hypothetical protein CBR_g34488 [Chara braunii]